MNITSIVIPPVSNRFYNSLVEAFPTLDPLDIKSNTTMIDIQRNAAQQEVLNYISKAVVKVNNEPIPVTRIQRLHTWIGKYVY